MFLIKFLFAVLIIICAVFHILYVWDFSLVLLIVVCAVPIFMFASLFITKKLLTVEFAVKSKSASKQEAFDVQLCVTNKSFFPIGKAEAVVDYYNVFNNQINSIELHFPIQSRNSQRLTFQLSSKFCGMIKIRSAYVTIYDPLRIFKLKVGRNIGENIVILPEGHEISGIVTSSDRSNDESMSYSEYKSGDDPSEVFDLREYNAGDKLNHIHWKLSSKKDEFIVKEYSMPIDSPAAIFLDLYCTEDSEYTLPIYDTLIESLVSISQFLLENERIHTIIYYNAAEKQFAQRIIDSIDKLASAVQEMILSLSDDLYSEIPAMFLEENISCGWTSFTLISTEPDEKLLSYVDNGMDADIKNVIAVMKNAEVMGSVSKPFSSLNIIPVVIGRISSSVRDIEF